MYWNISDVSLAMIGGLLMGICTSLHLILKGRTTGFSGILYGIFTFDMKSLFWKIALMMGVTCMSSIFFKIYGYFFS